MFYYKNKGLPLCLKNDFGQETAEAGSNIIQLRGPIFDHFLQNLGPHVSNPTKHSPAVLIRIIGGRATSLRREIMHSPKYKCKCLIQRVPHTMLRE